MDSPHRYPCAAVARPLARLTRAQSACDRDAPPASSATSNNVGADRLRLDHEVTRMPLTPAEVHNVAFKKPPIGKRGYDEEEVDAFLDIVEVELARLIEENNDLRAAAERGGGRPAGPVGAVGDPRLAQENAELKAQLDRLNRDKAAAEQAARAMQA